MTVWVVRQSAVAFPRDVNDITRTSVYRRSTHYPSFAHKVHKKGCAFCGLYLIRMCIFGIILYFSMQSYIGGSKQNQ